MGEFANQNIFVSGATSGIGRAVAVAFGRAGARVGVFGRNEEAAHTACEEIAAAGGDGAERIRADLWGGQKCRRGARVELDLQDSVPQRRR